MNRTLTFLLLASLAFSEPASPVPNPHEGYSTEMLRSPLFEPAQVAIEVTRINNWLNGSHAALDAEQMKGPREHLYYLIDSHVKHRYAESGRVMPTGHDLLLEILFSWAEPLGVYGGNLVFNSVKSTETPPREPSLPMPDGISLALERDLLHVQSDLGWSVSFPYYFMIGMLQDFKRTDGMRTQLMVVSTGAARDRNGGHSQATIMVMFSPDADNEQFRAFWEQQFEIKETSERVKLGVASLVSQRNFVPSLGLHRELVFWEVDAGSLAVAYLGNDGTYQWNRQHYLDFLHAFNTHADGTPN